MVCRKYYLNLIIRISGIVLASLLFAILLFTFPNVSVLIIAALIIIMQVIFLIRYLNTINWILEDYFLALANNETNILVEKPLKEKGFNKLFELLQLIGAKQEKNRINQEIQNNYFKTIVSQTSVGLISFTDEGSVDFINDAAKHLFKVAALKNLNRLDSYQKGFSDYLIRLEPEKTVLIPLVIQDSMIQLSVKKVRLLVGEQEYSLLSLQNIKTQLDDKEIEAWQKLVRIQMHEIGNSITPMTSGINTVLALFWNSQMRSAIRPDQVTEELINRTVKGLELVKSRGDGLIQFVNDVRQFGSVMRIQPLTFKVRDLFLDIFNLMKEELKAIGTRLIIDCRESIEITADRKLMEQVLINLIKNAMEACESRPDGLICLSANCINDKTIIQIEDNGKGISEEMKDKIFIPFFTTKQKGSGIGLSFSRQLIRLHDGTLTFTSIPNKKTIFTITL